MDSQDSQATPRPGQIVTFYSYKGGTGRSMALANVGYLLAGRLPLESRGVLMIDWDLEAPGLHRYFDSKPSNWSSFSKGASRFSEELDSPPGLIEFFELAESKHLKVKIDDKDGQEEAEDPNFRVRAEIFDRFPSFVTPTGIDNLSLLRAGRFDASYPERIRQFDWERFHRRDPGFFRSFRYFLMNRYDFILIDSRTGLTDTSGICVQQMPEKLVLVFAPNRQNLEGVVDVALRSRRFRKESPDPRPLIIFPLASRIDSTNEGLRKVWRQGGNVGKVEIPGYQKIFERLCAELYDLDKCDLGPYFDATQVKHDGDYAYGETIAAQRGTTERLSLGFTFADFTRRLATLDVPWEPLPEEIESEESRNREERTISWAAYTVRKAKTLAIFSVSAAILIVLAFSVGQLSVWVRKMDRGSYEMEKKILVLNVEVENLKKNQQISRRDIDNLRDNQVGQLLDICQSLGGIIDFNRKSCTLKNGNILRYKFQ